MGRRKIDLAKLRASMDTPCPKCGYSIPPNETMRVSFTEIKCPKCSEVFQYSKTGENSVGMLESF
jgi:phage FluMu protein Com